MKAFHEISLSVALLPAMTALAYAHPGHISGGGETHSHWVALGLSVLAALGAVAIYFVSRRKKVRSASHRETA